MLQIKVPGKLYIAGEYAVTETGFPAILVAINRFINFKIQLSATKRGKIFSRQYQKQPSTWQRFNQKITLQEDNSDLQYVVEAIKVTEQYVRERGKDLCYFNLTIDSQLDSQKGKKFGLGSSAAVTVGTVRAVCALYGLNITNEQIFKLASLAHYNVQGNGSLGDVAAITFGGWIGYYSPDRNWLSAQSQLSIVQLINRQWPGLKIIPLTPPHDLKLLVGWSGSPASTVQLVTDFKKTQINAYHEFIIHSRKCVESMIQAFVVHDLQQIQDQIEINRQLLHQLSIQSTVNIETSQLEKLIQIAQKFGGAAKTSGAGGGDCGIAIFSKKVNTDKVIKAWRQNLILPLPLHVYQEE